MRNLVFNNCRQCLQARGVDMYVVLVLDRPFSIYFTMIRPGLALRVHHRLARRQAEGVLHLPTPRSSWKELSLADHSPRGFLYDLLHILIRQIEEAASHEHCCVGAEEEGECVALRANADVGKWHPCRQERHQSGVLR